MIELTSIIVAAWVAVCIVANRVVAARRNAPRRKLKPQIVSQEDGHTIVTRIWSDSSVAFDEAMAIHCDVCECVKKEIV